MVGFAEPTDPWLTPPATKHKTNPLPRASAAQRSVGEGWKQGIVPMELCVCVCGPEQTPICHWVGGSPHNHNTN